MGCGESKQAVATENTLTKSKSKSKNPEKTNPPIEKPIKDDTNVKNDDNVKENGKISDKSDDGNANPPEKKVEKEKEVADHEKKETAIEEKVDEPSMEGDIKKDEALVKGVEKEKVINVPNESPKKVGDVDRHDEPIAISGKSKEEKGEGAKVHEDKATAAVETKSSGKEKISEDSNETVNDGSTSDVKAN